MKTYWLYIGETLVTGVRCRIGATNHEVISHALECHDSMPCGSALYPAHAPFEIRNMIRQSEVLAG